MLIIKTKKGGFFFSSVGTSTYESKGVRDNKGKIVPYSEIVNIQNVGNVYSLIEEDQKLMKELWRIYKKRLRANKFMGITG